MIGRSHGIFAEPVTFGLALAGHHAEIARGRARLEAARREIAVGKIAGAVGTYAHLSPPIEKQRARGPGPRARDGGDAGRRARPARRVLRGAGARRGGRSSAWRPNVRHWQRSEVGEAEEAFTVGQKGSSAMPHKRNPILSENLCGLARIVRAAVVPALEDVALWHERDISHSSVERMIGPDATATLAFMLDRSAEHGAGPGRVPGEREEEPRARRRSSTSARRFSSRSSRRACRARTRTCSCSATRCTRGEARVGSAICSAPTPTWRRSSRRAARPPLRPGPRARARAGDPRSRARRLSARLDRRRRSGVERGAAHRAGRSRHARSGGLDRRRRRREHRRDGRRGAERRRRARRGRDARAQPRRGRRHRDGLPAGAREARRSARRVRRDGRRRADGPARPAGPPRADRARRGGLRQGRPLPHARDGPDHAARAPLGGLVLSWATTHAIGVPISDSQCGYTAITRDACARLDLDAPGPATVIPTTSCRSSRAAAPHRRGAGSRDLRRRGEPPQATARARHRGAHRARRGGPRSLCPRRDVDRPDPAVDVLAACEARARTNDALFSSRRTAGS